MSPLVIAHLGCIGTWRIGFLLSDGPPPSSRSMEVCWTVAELVDRQVVPLKLEQGALLHERCVKDPRSVVDTAITRPHPAATIPDPGTLYREPPYNRHRRAAQRYRRKQRGTGGGATERTT